MRFPLLLTVALAAATLSAAPQQTTFKSSTSLVEVDIIVKDKEGRFVSGLTADDFDVFEEGKPQPIKHFYLVTENPTTAGELPSNVVLPRAPDQTARRVFLLIFDSDHLSATSMGRVKDAAMRFVTEHFKPTDLGGVYVNGRMWRSRLTNTRQELLDGIHQLTPLLETPAKRIAELFTFPRIPSEFEAVRIEGGDIRVAEELTTQNCLTEPAECALEGQREYVRDQLEVKARQYVEEARRAADGTIQTLEHVTRNLARLEGRKTVVLISEGFFVNDVIAELPRIAGQAARSGITLYTLNARGTQGVGGRIIADASTPRGSLSMLGDTSQEGLDALAAETGGVAFRNTDDFAGALSSVAADTSSYYVLAYSPENATLDGKFRRIELKSKWAGVTIRARRGYIASPLPPPRALRR
jgi:VWFA-related protein